MNSKLKQFWGEFLDLYESMPCLWKVKSSEYSNRDLKNQCYRKMVDKLKEFDPDANREKVVKKINVFRTNYKRELNKIVKKCAKTSGGAGDGDDEKQQYESSLWYFEKLKFLDDQQESSKEPKSTMDTEDLHIEDIPPAKKRRKNETAAACRSITPPINDEYETITRTWANELRKMDPGQQLFAKKAINEILFEGQLGTLNRSSIQINTTAQQTYDDALEEDEATTDHEYLTTAKFEPGTPNRSPFHINTSAQTYDDTLEEDEQQTTDREDLTTEPVKKFTKDKKRKWMKECFKKRHEFSHEKFFRELQECKPNDFRNCFNLDGTTFEALLEMVGPLIKKKNTLLRDAISPSQRLAITLRYLATGESFEQLQEMSNTSAQSIGKIVVQTCQALTDSLKDYIKTPQNPEEWRSIADGFNDKWNFPNCLGAVDGKHLAIKKPPKSGSVFYNYKKFFSIVFMAVVNSNYEFIMVEADINGGLTDSDVLADSNFSKALQDNTLNIPTDADALPGSNKELPFVFVAGDGFVLGEHMMTPFSQMKLRLDRRIFNYRLERTRRIAENAMGIMFSRFGVFQRLIALSPEKAQTIVLACCHLHNYLRRNQDYISDRSVDWEDMKTSAIVEGTWRADCQVTPLWSGVKCENSTADAEMIRDLYCNYFSNEGLVAWQDDFV